MDVEKYAGRKKQELFLKAFRSCNYVLAEAFIKGRITEEMFRNWYIFDEEFRRQFDAVEDEQMFFLRQTLRELAAGTHPSADGKPDKALLRFLVIEHSKRKMGTPIELDADEFEMLRDVDFSDLKGLKELAKEEK